MVLAILLFLAFLLIIGKVCSYRDPEGEEWKYYWGLYEKGIITKKELNQVSNFLLMRHSIRF